ncbi:MAG: hypothetical protein A3G20_07075 [Acidobacteria bacterium RIFCSPLOWO2_12_FULL_59_11]|nr:MAG: hypothetical protein A3G20_07075 [Acidobacteria bacterium RIFCSPLOWO2_12_FULL_59_11]
MLLPPQENRLHLACQGSQSFPWQEQPVGAAHRATAKRRQALLVLACWTLLRSTAVAEPPPDPPSSPQSGGRILEHKRSPAVKGSTERGWLTGAATGLAGGVRQGDFWALHLRWGRVLTSPHGPNFLLGTLEYTFEFVPAMLIRQSSTVYGGGLNPLLWQYNFTSNPHWTPFLQFGGGGLLTTAKVPAQTSQFNFTPQGGIGVYSSGWSRAVVAFGMRYHHISNANMAERNPGRNSLLFYTGISWWR